MKRVLLTVSGNIAADLPANIAHGKRPRADYLEIAQTCDADIIDYQQARAESGRFGALLEKVGGADLLLAWACFQRRQHYRVIFTDGEQIGIPLAALLKYGAPRSRTAHMMIVHILSVKKKMLFFDWLGIQSHIDRFLVYATWQQRFIQHRWHLPAHRVLFTHFMVDTTFFSPDNVTIRSTERPCISTAGLEGRDYQTLLEAVKDLPVDVIIAAASPWSKRKNQTEGQQIPSNVLVQRYTQYELRQVYANSRFVVMPLQNVNFQAGITAILEAMAMGKAVICTRTPGQTDAVVEGETGLYVPPHEPAALRAAIRYLLEHPEQAERMGRAGRQRVETLMSLDVYAKRMRQYVDELGS
jgi:glycosyltransferase involved in cell wall biosynthesis